MQKITLYYDNAKPNARREELLEMLLGIKIEKIDFPQIQKELRAGYKSKSIRLDVFASNPKRNFDIELVAKITSCNF